jgi:hypothetical protein
MTETQLYSIEVIKMVPNESICFIQAPSSESKELISLMKTSAFAYYKQLVLTPTNKKELIKIIAIENVEEYFQSIEIKYNDQLLFEGYDGMVYGTISKDLKLTDWFIENCIDKELCIVSSEW